MARPTPPSRVSRNAPAVLTAAASGAMAGSAAVFKPGRRVNPTTDRAMIAKPWQVEAYRHVNTCGEARYAATLFANIAARAEVGVSEPQALARKAVWVKSGVEVDAWAEVVPTVRDRSKLLRDYMLHRTIAGECYLIARDRVDTDPDYETRAGEPLWEIVAVTELQKIGETWRVRHENGNYVELSDSDPVIRLWNPDPENRMEAWSPFRSLLPTLREIEWLTKHIFTQVRSRLMSAGVWFVPDNMTFPPPPPSAVEGGEEAIAAMNEAEQFMISLAASSMEMLDDDEVSLPSIVMADPVALAAVDKNKLIQFWSEIDDKAMVLRSDAVRRFALGMDLPPEQVLGSSGLAVTGAGGSAGSVNHWGVWANEEQTISAHIEPALDDFTGTLTYAFLRLAVDGTDKVLGYDTATLRLRQDRSKEAIELYDRGELKAEVMLREVGFDPDNDRMSPEEHQRWLLNRLASGSASPEMVAGAMALLGVSLPAAPPAPEPAPRELEAPRMPDSAVPSLEDHPYEGPPRVDHEHNDAPFSAFHASSEGVVLRALEKYGNRLLNSGKRGKDRDRTTPPHLAHLALRPEHPVKAGDFDLSMANIVVVSSSPGVQTAWVNALGRFCARLVNEGEPYTRESLIEAVEGL
jgi:hypothetical protein